MLTTQNTKHSKSLFIPFTGMSKTFSKFSLFLIVLANINPVLAVSKYQNTELSKQKLDYQINPQGIIVAGLFGDVTNFINDVDKTRDTIERRDTQRRERERRLEEKRIRLEMQQREREQRLQERQARQEERKRRQEELQAARKAATERQIQEAERRRQYFESLSPEQKQAYIKQQQAIKKKQAEANLFMLGLFAEFLNGGSGSSSQASPERNDLEELREQQRINERQRLPEQPQPASAPIEPIGGNNGLYGSCHSSDCR
ncbi:hypothetical protein [Nostoc sp.]|uniref:hypothetical protein n=1 Tax=Nostoc sp. TaxID=1180 RepID=UPI002FFAEDD1